MKYATFQAKVTRQTKSISPRHSSGGREAISVAPPGYGIDFVDQGMERTAPAQRRCPACSESSEGASENWTGMPDQLLSGIEHLSGLDMSDVRVHYNSPKPAQLQSLAYTQGTEIYVGPGQERHLPHEAWHAVQQKQRRVRPTKQLQGVDVNDDVGLEREADVMGARVARNLVGGAAWPGSPGGRFSLSSATGHSSAALQAKGRWNGALVQMQMESSFPESLTEEELLSAKRGGQSAQLKSSNSVVQMRGGVTVGRLCIVSNAVNDGLTAGHAWLSYTPTGGAETTYGTWGNVVPIGLHRDREVGRPGKARRCTDVDAADIVSLNSFATANNSWGYMNNCASFAARGWLAVTGESISYTSFGIPNPSALGAGIVAKGGVLAPGAGGGSSASSGSSYGSSSLASIGPGSSG